ncbi:putative photosynthetic complex assembly protein PuhE [Rhizobium sp. AAP116]|uniref:putative photosynthetic complex assembly protein PuhE n=1 Tax=Rhizobium sp. AAP116 TaxID=1523429 RepID=UPI0006B91373|nr:putative photosynthetic complex assembly protein PuhE [Rhizobium sp. AAP116]KPF61214.1 photosynthetic complex assembly protein 2 [Rhizobium sp. AAP116]
MTFTHPLAVVLVAISVWWLSTGLVLAMVNRSDGPRRRGLVLMGLMTVIGAFGFGLMLWGAQEPTVFGSYVGFFGALLVWAWHEAAFLTGLLTGRRTGECPPGLTGFSRFRAAWEAVSDHEIAILVTAIALWLTLEGSANLFGLAAFGLLWGMRISAKLVIFLGAPHAVSELMPKGIRHLKSYFKTDRMTPLFPIFLAIAAGIFAVLVVGANRATHAHSVVGHTLLATFMALAIVEHLVLVLPVSDTALWRWAMARQDRANLAIRPAADGVSALKEGGPVSVPHTSWTAIAKDTIGKRKD